MSATQTNAPAQAELIELETRAANGEYITPAALWDAREEAALEAFGRAADASGDVQKCRFLSVRFIVEDCTDEPAKTSISSAIQPARIPRV